MSLGGPGSEARHDSSVVGRAAERIARNIDRRSFMKKALLAGVTITYLDRLAKPAFAGEAPVYIDAGPTALTDRLNLINMGCCSGSQACYNFGNPRCGCQNACCYQPAHSGNPCAKRNSGYCWTCNSGSYVCCDYWCYGNACHCGSQCSYNQCGTGKC